MDLILRYLNARGFLIVGGTIAALVLLAKFYDAPYRWYQDRKFAQERGGAAPAPDIARDLDARESLKLKGLYRDVSAEIAAAKARGRPVDSLQAAADAAVRMDSPATRAFAMDTLNRLRLAIPQPLDAVRPSAGEEEPPDAVPTPASSPAPARRRRRSPR
ncbi:MAG TPA: hypothetical protein VH309_01705 [Elusimicrobiota bacterium]|jgi:hypothetical protein|nr:hypothetical protein [Elusimicrobiota bacterium]